MIKFLVMSRLRLAVICDYPEENWHSMDLCADMLIEYLQLEHSHSFEILKVCPKFQPRLQLLPWLGKKKAAYNFDRLINRFWDYPNYLKTRVKDFDLFHIADHTYSQMAHVLPSDRTGIFCHDIDAFRSILEPNKEPRPIWYRAMSERILSGLQKANVVFFSTLEVKKQIEHFQIIDSERLIQAIYGISEDFSPDSSSPLLDTVKKITKPYLLHVGSCIPRKRIDVLLDVFARVKSLYPEFKLVKVGGEWTEEQRSQIQALNLENSIIHLQNLERTEIADLYRQAIAVLVTSEAEGFGLPAIEALACGAVVIANDIPVLQEVGGEASIYCPISDLSAWVDKIAHVINQSEQVPNLDMRLAQAQKYSWSNHAEIVARAFLKLVNTGDKQEKVDKKSPETNATGFL
jgi:glycosyltransferase involved in cell wall biosynthesis